MSAWNNATQIKEASRALDAARQTFDCLEPRKDTLGNRTSETGVAYGTHGSAFLQINPSTLKVRCGACAGDLDATVKPKTARKVGKRVRLVSA